MVYDIIFDVLSAWQVIAVGLLIMIILPVVFYFASFDKSPVKIKRVPDKKKSDSDKSNVRKRKQEEDEADETDDEDDGRRDRNSRKDIIED